jgi:hypothetical protein
VWIDARSSVHPIHSESSGLAGWFEGDVPAGGRLEMAVTPQGHLELPIELLSSGNGLYDREMRRRVDARRDPAIVGELAAMKETDGDGRYLVTGDVCFRGVTREYQGQMVLSMPDERTISLEGERMFDIREFGMSPPRILMFQIYPEVAVKVRIVAEQEE